MENNVQKAKEDRFIEDCRITFGHLPDDVESALRYGFRKGSESICSCTCHNLTTVADPYPEGVSPDGSIDVDSILSLAEQGVSVDDTGCVETMTGRRLRIVKRLQK